MQQTCWNAYQWQKYNKHCHRTITFNNLKSFIIADWPDTKDELHADLRPYWSHRDKLAVIDGLVLKGRHIVIPNSLRQQVLSQLHTNYMGIEKTKLLAHESVYWSSICADIRLDYLFSKY